MKSKTHFLKNQDGASAILISIVLAMLLGFTALAVDVGYMYTTRNELQNVADAAALAGAGKLGQIYLNLAGGYVAQQTFDVDGSNPNPSYATYRSEIEYIAEDTANKNKAADDPSISINPADIYIGQWNFNATPPTDPLDATVNIQPNAVRVYARRDSTMNNAVSTFFGFIFSFFGSSADTFEVSAVATAALSGPSTFEDGELITPVGISRNFFNNPNPCLTLIEFSPTTDSCAGWHNFFDSINAAAVADKLISFIEAYDYNGTIDGVAYNGTNEGQNWLSNHFNISQTVTPEVTEGSQDPDPTIFNFQGGTIASLFLGGYYDSWTDKDTPGGPVQDNVKKPAPFITLFDFFRFRDNDDVNNGGPIATCAGPMDPDDVWTATVPVYDEGDTCSNPNSPLNIIGSAKVQIIMPNPPPSNTIQACVDCNLSVIDGRGGGGTYGGVLGRIPNLVQ